MCLGVKMKREVGKEQGKRAVAEALFPNTPRKSRLIVWHQHKRDPLLKIRKKKRSKRCEDAAQPLKKTV